MTSGAMDIVADPGCSRVTDPDMAGDSSPVSDDTMAPVATWPQDVAYIQGIHVAFGGTVAHRLQKP